MTIKSSQTLVSEALKEIKVVAPAYIESFTREFKKLLNE